MEQLTEKQMFIINAKLQFIDKQEIIQFYVEADNHKQAENKLYQWLEGNNSDLKFTNILSVWTEKNIYVIF